MGGWIVGRDRLVETFANDLAIEDDNRANGDFAGGGRCRGLFECTPHEQFVFHVPKSYVAGGMMNGVAGSDAFAIRANFAKSA